MFLLIDNYDSFSHNLARYLREAGAEIAVHRNDAMTAKAFAALSPAAVIISPGPGRPSEAGVCLELLRLLPPSTPMLGVCLGHQCLVEAFGGETRRARRPLHGEASMISHDGDALFAGAPPQFEAGRYHSLIAAPAPHGPIRAIAWSEEGEVMAVRHCAQPWFGVQFHPESLLTPYGRVIIGNFIAIAQAAGSGL